MKLINQFSSHVTKYFSLLCFLLFMTAPILGFAQTDDFAIEPVGQFGGSVHCGDALGEYAYLGQGTGLSIYEIQNGSISQLSHIDLPQKVLDLQVVGNYLYAVLDESGGFYVIDISNPANPDTVGSCDIETQRNAGVYVNSNYAYVAAGRGGFQIVDVSNPAAPTIAKIVTGFYPDDIFVANGNAYTVTSSTSPAKFRIFDLSDPLDPKYKGQLNIEAASKVTVSGNYAYIACSQYHGGDLNGLRIIDISDPTNPVEQSYFSTADATYSSVIEGNYAYVGMEDSLLVLNISDKSTPQKVGDYEIPDASWSKVRCFHYESSQVFLAVHGEDLPLQILDVSDPSNPQPAASYKAPDAIISLRTGNSHLYVTSFNSLLVYDLSNPSSPAFLKEYEEFNNLGFLQFENSTLYGISGNGDKLLLLNAANPNNLVQMGEYTAQSSWFGHFVIDQNRSYLQTNDKRLEIADISDPSSPQFLGQANLAGELRDIAVKDTLIFSAYRNSETERGVEIFSVSSPAQPFLISTIASAGTPNALWIDADTLYVGGNTTDQDYFLQAFLINDPASPQLLAGVNGSGKLWDIEVRNGAILAAVEGGSVIRFALNAVASVLQQVAECPSPGSLQITTTPPAETGESTLYTSEGKSWSSPTVALTKKREPNRVEGAQSTMSMCNYGEYGVAIQKFKTKKPGPIPTLTLTKNSVQYEPICPVCDTCEVEATIAQVTIAVDEVDSWQVATIKFQAFGSGDEANDVRTAVLYEGGTVLDSTKYTADDGSVTLSINKTFQPGETKVFRLTYKFKPDMQPINKIREYNVKAWIGWLVAEPDNYANYKMLPPNPFDNGTQLIAPVKNLQTGEYFANIQDAIDDDDTKDGHTVEVCPGYYLENVDVTKSLTIRSIGGRDVTYVQAADSTDHVFHVMKDNTVIDGFTIEYAKEANGVYIFGSTLSNCKVLNNNIEYNQSGVFLESASNCTISGNKISFNNTGVEVKKGSKNNLIGGNRNNSKGNLISGNLYEGIAIGDQGSSGNRIIGNNIGVSEDGLFNMRNVFGITTADNADSNYIGGSEKETRNIISGNLQQGVFICSNYNTIKGNTIGLNITGTDTIPNDKGIEIFAGKSNIIENNLISGNKWDGILIDGNGADANKIIGNYIGPDEDGFIPQEILKTSFGNNVGIHIKGGAKNNIIGGSTAEHRNIISGNKMQGMLIEDEGTELNKVKGNYIGMDKNGKNFLMNWYGIVINNGARLNVIGGTTDGEKNIISGNKAGNLNINGKGTDENKVIGNYIGPDVNGHKVNIIGDNHVGFLEEGVMIEQRAKKNIIGGNTPGERNIISGNWYSGVQIRDEATENSIINNYIGINIEGTTALSNNYGIILEDSCNSNLIENNVISGNKHYGVFITHTNVITGLGSTENNIIVNNLIGTDKTGTLPVGNAGGGVALWRWAKSNRIERNVISGNIGNGIHIDRGSDKNVIIENYIGVDKTGTKSIVNSKNGITIVGTHRETKLNIIQKNVISGNYYNGVRLDDYARENLIIGNLIGTDFTGKAAIPNLRSGILIVTGANHNTVGGIREEDRNIISGNNYKGIWIVGVKWSGDNKIIGNYIGTDISGQQALPNGTVGIMISDGSFRNIIGGSTEAERNIISGNSYSGIQIDGLNTTNNEVVGNYIGTNVDGTSAVPNKVHGVLLIDKATQNVIGGKEIGKRNIISGNGWNGVSIQETGIQGNKVWGNYIGTDKNGTAAVPNNHNGIFIGSAADSNTIGGKENGAGNLVSGNKESGVKLDFGVKMNRIIGNYIGTTANGKNKLANGTGITIQNNSFSNLIERNIISANNSNGVAIRASSRNQIFGNTIGLSEAGSILGNSESGILIAGGRANKITGNTISANNISGITISNSDKNEIFRNRIGTDRSGTFAIPNVNGIHITNRATLNIIGGKNDGGNIISGNTKNGIRIEGHETNENKILGNYIGTDSSGTVELGNKENGIHLLEYCADNTITSNKIWYNCTGVREENSDNEISNNSIRYNTCSTGIHITNAGGNITGNSISHDEGDGIKCENGSNPFIQKNNIYENIGFALNNADPAVTINAQGNWWGDASGPGGAGSGSGDEVNGAVDFSGWRISPVALIANSGADTVFVKTGTTDSVFCFFQNWENLNDVIDVSVTDSLGWLQSSANFTLALTDSMGADTSLYLTVPASAQPGTSSKFWINAVSTYDPSVQDTDSLLVICYLSELERIFVSPDSIVIEPGATVQFRASGFDQKKNDVIFEPIWSATSGTIDSTGLFTADSTEGTVTITVADGASPVTGTAFIQVSAAAPTLTRITVTPDSVRLNPGGSKQFEANGYDQFGMPINFSAQWSASGGTISSSGIYTAGDETGAFTVTATDTSVNLSGQAVVIIQNISSVEESTVIPDNYCLHQNYPNPFNPETTIRFDVKERTPVVLKVYDLLGREVKVLVNSVHQPGSYRIIFDAKNFATGVYFYRIQMKDFVAVKKMVLLE